MANRKARQFPRLEPCAIGKQIDSILGDERKARVARRRALAARLGVSDQYLHFLATGEVDHAGKLMTPSDKLAASFRTVVEELGGKPKAVAAALDAAAPSTPAAAPKPAPAATPAPAAEKATKPAPKASKAAKAVKKPKTVAKTAKARKASGRKARKGAK